MPFTSRRLGGNSKTVWAKVMAAAVTAALAGVNRHAQGAVGTLTWDPSGAHAASNAGGIWATGTGNANWYNGNSDIQWPLTNAATPTQNIAVFGSGSTALNSTNGTNLQVVVSTDDKGVAGMTFNTLGGFQQISQNLSGTWAANTNVITLSNLTNIRPGETIASATGIPAGAVILAVNTASNQVTISQVTTAAGTNAALNTTSGYILAGNFAIAPVLSVSTITLGANTDTIFDNTFTNYANAPTANSLAGMYITNTSFAGSLGNLTGASSLLFAGSGTLTFPGFQGLNATLGSGFTGTVIFGGGGAPTIANSSTSSVPNLTILNGTAIFAKTGTGSALGTNSIISINGANAKLQLGAVTGNSAGQIGDNSTITLSAGEFDLNNNANEVIGVLNDAGPGSTGIIDNTAPGTSSTLTLNGNLASNFNGVIRSTGGTLGIGKTGGGTLTLTNQNTFNGPFAITGGRVILSGTGSAANSAAQIVNSLVIIDDSQNTNSDITRLGSVLISSNSPLAADGLQVQGNTNTIDRVGDITINTSSSALGTASGLAIFNFGFGNASPFTLQANSINRGANGIGVFVLSDGGNGAFLGNAIKFKVNTLPSSVNGIVPWGYVPNTGFLVYDNTNGFKLANFSDSNMTDSIQDGNTDATLNFSGNVGVSSVTSTTYNSIFENGSGSLTIGNNMTVSSGGIAVSASSTFGILGGTLTLPNGGFFYAGGGSTFDLSTDIKSSGNVELVQTDGTPNANFVLGAPSPDFTGSLFFGGVNGGVTLTLSDVNALTNATLDTSIGSGRLLLTTNGSVHMLYNVGALAGTGNLTISGGASQNYINTLITGNNSQNTTFSGQLIEQGGGGISADFLQKVGTGTWTLTGTADNAGFNLKVVQGSVVLAKASTASGHAAADLWLAGGNAIISGSGNAQVYGGGSLIIDAGTLDLNGNNQVFGILTGGGGVITNNATGNQLAIFTYTPGSNGATRNFSGGFMDGLSPIGVVIGGTNSVNLVLSGVSNYSGPTSINANSTLTVLNTTTMGSLSIFSTNNSATNLLVVNGAMNVNGAFTFGSTASSVSLTNLLLTGSGSFMVNGSLIGSINTAGAMNTVQTITWNGPGNFGIGGANSPFAGSLTLISGNLVMNGGSISNSTLTTLSGVSNGLTFTNSTGGTLNRLTNVVLQGSSAFVSATGGSSATTDNITGTLTLGGADQINVLTGGATETLNINNLNVLTGTALKINTNATLGGDARLLIGNGTSFLVGGIIPFAVAGSGNTFLGLVTYNSTAGVELAQSNVSQIVNGGDSSHAGDIFSGSLDSAANPFTSGGSNTQPTIVGALINTANNAIFTLGNTLTLASGALASSAPSFTINDVSGNGTGKLNFGSQQGAIFPAGGGTVTINAQMIGTKGVALISGSNLGTNFILNSANSVGGYTSVGGGDTLTLTNALALADSALNIGSTSNLIFSGANAFTLGGLGGGLSVPLVNAAAAPITLYVGAGNVNTTYAGNLSGGGTLVKVGNTVMSLDYLQGANNWTNTGGVIINGGKLSMVDFPLSTNNITVNTFGGTTILVNAGGTLDFNNAITTNSIYVPNNIVLNGGSISVESNVVHLGSNSNNATAATLTTVSIAPGTNGTMVTNASGMDIDLDGFLNLPANSTLTIANSGVVSQGGVWFNNTTNTSVLGTILINGTSNAGGRILINNAVELANAALFVSGGSNQSDFVITNATIGSLAGSGVFALSGFGTSTILTEGALGSTTWAGDLTGGGTLTKVGTSTFTLTGTSSLTGGISVAGGSVVMNGSASAAGATLIVTPLGSAVIDASNSVASQSTRVANVNLGQIGLAQPALTVIGNSSVSTQVVNGAITASIGLAEMKLQAGSGTLTVQANALAHNNGALNITTDGTLGTNAFLKVNNYTNNSRTAGLTLIGAGSYSSGIPTTAINAPVIPYVLVNSAGFGTYDAVNNSVVLAGSESTLTDGESAGNNFAGNANGLTLTTATNINSFFNTATATATINNVLNIGSGGLATAADLTLSGSGTITSNGTLFGASATTNNELILTSIGHNVVINPVIAGSNGVTFAGNSGASFTLNGINTFSGPTNISGTQVVLGNASALAFSTYNDIAANNGTLNFGTITNPVLGGIQTDAATTLTIPSGVNLTVGNNNSNTTIAGLITGGGKLTKIGTGTLNLPNPGNFFANYTWTGGLEVDNGLVTFSNLNPLQTTFQYAPPAGTITLGHQTIGTVTSGGTIEYNTGSNSGNYFIPNIVFDGGQLQSDDGVIHLGADSSNHVYPIVVTSAGGTITSSWNNKNVIVDGLVMNGAGTPGTLTIQDRDGGGSSATQFTNPNNTFSGTVVLNATVQGGSSLAIANAGTSGTALQFATIVLNGNKGNGSVTETGPNNTNRPTTGGGNALVFNDTTGTMVAAVIGGLSSNGNFALATTAPGNPGINLTIAPNGTAAAAYSGQMSGAGSLTIGGTGTVTLSGSNNYAGNTTLLSGVLALGAPHVLGATGNGTGGIVFSGGTLQLASGISGNGIDAADDLTSRFSTTGASNIILDSNGQAVTWGGSISSNVNGLVKLGDGTITLGGSNFTGATTINKGRYAIGQGAGTFNVLGGELSPNGSFSDIAGAVNVASGAGISMIDGSTGNFEVDGPVTLAGGSYLGFDLGSGGGSDEMLMESSLTVNGTGTVAVNLGLATGQVPSATGSYNLLFSQGSINLANYSVGSVPNGFSVTLSVSGNNLVAEADYVAPFSTYWTGAQNGLWNYNNGGNTNWATDVTGDAANAAPGILTDVFFSASTAGAGPINSSLGGDTQVSSITFNGSQTVFVGGSSNLYIAAISGNGITLANGAGPVTINTTGKVQLGANQIWDNESATSALTIASSITGNYGLTLQGNGTIQLNGSNSYTGGTTIVSGIVQTGNSGALANGSVTMNGGTLDVHGFAVAAGMLSGPGGVITNLASTAGTLTINTGTTNNSNTFAGTIADGPTATTALNILGNGTLVLTGINTATGNFTQGSSDLQIGDGTTSGGFNGNDKVTGGTLTFAPGSAPVTYSGLLSGSGKLGLAGGQLTVSNSNNSFTGGTNINAGTLSLGNNNPLGNNSVVNLAAGSFLDLNGFNLNVSNITGSGTVYNLGTGTSMLSFVVPTGQNQTLGAVISDNGGANSGFVGVSQLGAGTLTMNLTDMNYTGPTTIANGWVRQLSALNITTNLFAPGGTVTMGANGVLDTIVNNNNSGYYYIPDLILNGGTIISDDGHLFLGGDSSNGGNGAHVITVNGGATLSPWYNNKNIEVIGQLTNGTNSTGGTINVADAGPAPYPSGVEFENPNNTFNGVINVWNGTTGPTGTNNSGTAIAITASNALQYATINLNGNTTSSGMITILQPQGAPALGATAGGSNVLVFNDTTAAMTTATIGGLMGSGNFGLYLTDAGTTSLTLTVNQIAGVDNYSGIMSGGGSLTKSGAGTMILSGPNTFTGAASVTGGMLILQNSSALQAAVVSSGSNMIGFDKAPIGQPGLFQMGQLTGNGNIALVDNSATPKGVELQVGLNNVNTTYSGVLSGAGTITQAGTGSLLLTGANNITGALNVASGFVEIGGGNSQTVGAVKLVGNLQVDSGTTLHSNGVNGPGNWTIIGNQVINASGTAGGASDPGSLTLGGSGHLDLNNNLLVVKASANHAAELAAILNDVASGTISSSTLPLTPGTKLAVVDNSSYTTPKTTMRGETLAPSDILVVQALSGDTNLSGTVDFNDFTTLLQYYNTAQANRGWAQGNSTGSTPFNDLTALLQNYGHSFGSFSVSPSDGTSLSLAPAGNSGGGSSPVPEPASLAVLALGGAALLTRRRRKI